MAIYYLFLYDVFKVQLTVVTVIRTRNDFRTLITVQLFFFDLAATYSSTPSPVQYLRPLMS